MKKWKQILLQAPEYLLIIAVAFYWISTANLFNPFAITLIIGLILQIKFENKVIGITIPVLLILVSAFLILALFSELNEFPTFNEEARKLLIIGLSYFIVTMIISGLMIIKYAILKDKNTH
jgi:hypothetical protein